MKSVKHTTPAGLIKDTDYAQDHEVIGVADEVHTHAPGEVTGGAIVEGDSRLSNARTPTAHNHAWADINSGKPTTLAGYGITDAITQTATSAAAPATTGTMTVPAGSGAEHFVTITPTGACTFNATGGVVGQKMTFLVTTSGTSAFVLTFGTNFRKVGTLSTGTVSARYFAVTFVCYATGLWMERCRTAVQS
jgi:hypothetical protein